MSPKAYFLVWVDGNKVCPIYRRWWKGRKNSGAKDFKRREESRGTNREKGALMCTFSCTQQGLRLGSKIQSEIQKCLKYQNVSSTKMSDSLKCEVVNYDVRFFFRLLYKSTLAHGSSMHFNANSHWSSDIFYQLLK